MSITAAIGRIDQILTLQQQLANPASLVSGSSDTSGGAALTGSSSSTASTDFTSALASAQGETGNTSSLEAASALDPEAAALGDTSPTASATDPTSLLGTGGLLGSTALPGTTSGIAASSASSASSSAPSQVQAMTNEANSLVGKPYVYGGGHSGWGPQAGYDCSGFVSAVLHAGGYLSSPADTVTLPSQAGIEQGPGQYVTIYDRTGSGEDGHVIIDINGQFYESGGEQGAWGGGGGVEKIGTPSASYLATFNDVLHPAGL